MRAEASKGYSHQNIHPATTGLVRVMPPRWSMADGHQGDHRPRKFEKKRGRFFTLYTLSGWDLARDGGAETRVAADGEAVHFNSRFSVRASSRRLPRRKIPAVGFIAATTRTATVSTDFTTRPTGPTQPPPSRVRR
jgi:hypothetical protein